MLEIQECIVNGRRKGWQAPDGRCYLYKEGDVRSENRAKYRAGLDLLELENKIKDIPLKKTKKKHA